mgnify:CR=1 FL=1
MVKFNVTEEEALRVRRTYPGVDLVVRGTGDMEWNAKYDGTDRTGIARATRYGTGLGATDYYAPELKRVSVTCCGCEASVGRVGRHCCCCENDAVRDQAEQRE